MGLGTALPSDSQSVRQDSSMAAHPPIRSFKGRTGRMGTKQLDSWAAAEQTIMLPNARWNLPRPVTLDIGSGMGEATLSLARAEPHRTVVAIDVFRRGLANTMHSVSTEQLTNVRVFSGDCLRALEQYVPARSVSQIVVWFPDPWPKRNQRKRRLIRPWFLKLAAQALSGNGELRIATDSADYAMEIDAVISADPGLTGGQTKRPQWRPVTKFERKGIAANREIVDFCYHAVRDANRPGVE